VVEVSAAVVVDSVEAAEARSVAVALAAAGNRLTLWGRVSDPTVVNVNSAKVA